MRGRILAVGACLLTLTACATPRAIGQGDVTGVRGAAVADYGSQADGEDAAYAKAVQGHAISRLGGVVGGAPAYLIQVGVASSPPTVGVSSAMGALDDKAWRSQPPPRRPWSRKGPVRTVTLAVLEAGTGKTVAWSSIRIRQKNGSEPATVADLLVAALRAPTKG